MVFIRAQYFAAEFVGGVVEEARHFFCFMVYMYLQFNLRSSFHGHRLELKAAAAKHLHVTLLAYV